MPDTESQSANRPRVNRSIVLLAVYAVFTGWLFCLQATSWPHEGSWALFGYLIFLPGIVFHSANLAWKKIDGHPIPRPFLARLVTVPLGIMFAALLNVAASAFAMANFERAYAPFVAQLGTSLGEACNSGPKYFAISSVAEFNEQTSSRPTAFLHHDGKRFVLRFMGGSIDMDGSTLYFDSEAREWRRYHNNNVEAHAIHQKLIAGLADCKLRAGQ